MGMAHGHFTRNPEWQRIDKSRPRGSESEATWHAFLIHLCVCVCIFKRFIYSFRKKMMCMCVACVSSFCLVCVQMPREARGCWVPRSWNKRGFWDTWCGLWVPNLVLMGAQYLSEGFCGQTTWPKATWGKEFISGYTFPSSWKGSQGRSSSRAWRQKLRQKPRRNITY